MSSKELILTNLETNSRVKQEMPDMDAFEATQYADRLTQFIEISQMVGGSAVVLEEGQDVNTLIQSLYPDAKSIASNLAEIIIATTNPDTVQSGHDLNGTDLGIVKGELGVAENGCVWIPQNVKEKALYFISEYLVIILDKDKIVNNMLEAYQQIEFSDKGFGVFISGPSKTADIEQALVVGAHGAKGLTVILR